MCCKFNFKTPQHDKFPDFNTKSSPEKSRDYPNMPSDFEKALNQCRSLHFGKGSIVGGQLIGARLLIRVLGAPGGGGAGSAPGQTNWVDTRPRDLPGRLSGGSSASFQPLPV